MGEGKEVTVRVLIVDDQEPFRAVARDVVEEAAGFEVVGEAASGEESVEVARSLAPDLVLMDVNLPGIDGTEATRRIIAENAQVRVLLLSTYEEEDYASAAGECGAIGFIPKSAFDPEALEHAWRTAG